MKKLILPTPRENIDSIFKANNLSKIEIDNILKIKRISHTTLPAYYTETKNAESLTDIESELNNTLVTAHTTRLPSLAGAHSERTCVASSLENKLNLSKVSFQFMPEQSEREILKQGETSKAISPYKSSDNIYTLSLGFKKTELLNKRAGNNKDKLSNYQENNVFVAYQREKKINLLENLLYYNSKHTSAASFAACRMPAFASALLASVASASSALQEAEEAEEGTSARQQIPAFLVYAATQRQASSKLISAKVSCQPVSIRKILPILAAPQLSASANTVKRTYKNKCAARRLINKIKNIIIFSNNFGSKTLINRKKIDPFKIRYLNYVTLQIKRKLFYARMSRLVNKIKKNIK